MRPVSIEPVNVSRGIRSCAGQRGPRRGAEPGHDVDDTGRNAGLAGEPLELDDRDRRLLARLGDHDVAGRHGGREAPGGQQQRRVPGMMWPVARRAPAPRTRRRAGAWARRSTPRCRGPARRRTRSTRPTSRPRCCTRRACGRCSGSRAPRAARRCRGWTGRASSRIRLRSSAVSPIHAGSAVSAACTACSISSAPHRVDSAYCSPVRGSTSGMLFGTEELLAADDRGIHGTQAARRRRSCWVQSCHGRCSP